MLPSLDEVVQPACGGRCRFELARPVDDAQLRALLRAAPLGGAVRTTLRREPNYFVGAATEGPFHQVLVAREEATNAVVGMATRSVRDRYVDGVPAAVGYLGGLRLHPQVRNGWVIARGFRALRRLHEDGRTPFYLTTITAGNDRALETLLGGRAGLPHYVELGKYFTFVLRTLGGRLARELPGIDTRPLTPAQLPQLLGFLHEHGRGRQFFPCLSERDFQSTSGTFVGLPLEQIVCAWQGTEIVGTLARWDQSAFKQTFVESYGGVWRWARFPFNALARLRGWPRYPAPGEPLRHQMLALPVIPGGDAAIWRALLGHVRTLPTDRPHDCLLLGLFESDPLVSWARHEALHCYVSRLFAVSWNPEQLQPQRFVGRDVYLELGCL